MAYTKHLSWSPGQFTSLSDINLCLDLRTNRPAGHYAKLLDNLDPDRERAVAMLYFAKRVVELTGRCADCLHRHDDVVSEAAIEEDFSLDEVLLLVTDLRANFGKCDKEYSLCPRCQHVQSDSALKEEEQKDRTRCIESAARKIEEQKTRQEYYRYLQDMEMDDVHEQLRKEEEERKRRNSREEEDKEEEKRNVRIEKTRLLCTPTGERPKEEKREEKEEEEGVEEKKEKKTKPATIFIGGVFPAEKK
jgi:hypothetical protein